jgi:hypothetical protein
VPKPEVVTYEYESWLYCHPFSSQPVIYRQECFGADIATQTLGGFFVSWGRRDILHASGFRVVPMHEKISFPFPKGTPEGVPKGGFLSSGRCKIRCLRIHSAQKSTERPPVEVACHTKSVAPSLLAHPRKAYLPECVDDGYCELRLYGVLGKFRGQEVPPQCRSARGRHAVDHHPALRAGRPRSVHYLGSADQPSG